MNPAVEGYTAALVDGVDEGDRDALAADLAAIDRLLQSNGILRTAMTDVGMPGPARRAVLEELLEGKVHPAARRLAGYVTGTVHAPEVPATIHWVATRVHLIADEGMQPEALLAHRPARQRVGGYAAAVFEDLSPDELEEVEDELFRLARTVASTPALRSALANADLPVVVRCEVVDDLLSGKVHEATLRLVRYAIRGGRARDIVGTLDWLVEQTAVARGWRVARVRAGQEIDGDERQRLAETLSRLTGSPVELQVTVDPGLLAGVDVQIGDLWLDATARGRLERFRDYVVTGAWREQGLATLQGDADEEHDGGAPRRPEGTVQGS